MLNESSRLRTWPHRPLAFGVAAFQMRFRSSWSSPSTVVAPIISTKKLIADWTSPSSLFEAASRMLRTPSAPVSPSRPESCVMSSCCASSRPMTSPATVITSTSRGAIDSIE